MNSFSLHCNKHRGGDWEFQLCIHTPLNIWCPKTPTVSWEIWIWASLMGRTLHFKCNFINAIKHFFTLDVQLDFGSFNYLPNLSLFFFFFVPISVAASIWGAAHPTPVPGSSLAEVCGWPCVQDEWLPCLQGWLRQYGRADARIWGFQIHMFLWQLRNTLSLFTSHWLNGSRLSWFGGQVFHSPPPPSIVKMAFRFALKDPLSGVLREADHTPLKFVSFSWKWGKKSPG